MLNDHDRGVISTEAEKEYKSMWFSNYAVADAAECALYSFH